MTIQNLQEAVKAVLRGKFIAVQSSSKSKQTGKMSNKEPNLIPKAIRKRRTKSSKVSRRKEILKIRTEMK